jgi:hypothetical protein
VNESEQRRKRPYRPDVIRVDRGDYARVSHQMVCNVCSCEYWEHAPVLGFEWLTRLCDGRLVKL